MGYTLNRVSLFALIFSIGILVDDAIVVVENIDRHWAMKDGPDRFGAAVDAVAEVGNPTIVATLTVIVALLPMMFVSGLMGPYMAPIPAVASAAMVFSFFSAMVLTPWLMVKLGGSAAPSPWRHPCGAAYRPRRRRPLILPARGPVAWLFLALTGLLTAASCCCSSPAT
jgi:multidrug efflux pump subunit AcrB